MNLEMNCINVIDSIARVSNKTNSKISNVLENQKQKLAIKLFESNSYIQNYVKTFFDKFEDSFIDESGDLNRYNSFDFSKIPATLKENFIEYMRDWHCLYHVSDNYYDGFSVLSCDNIYINSCENSIYSDFRYLGNKNERLFDPSFKTDLELFLKLELLMAKNGVYPDIVYVGYYGDYSSDYETPEEYKFLKTAMHEKEDRLIYFIENLIDLFDRDCYYLEDNFIVEEFTPEFIQKIRDNLSVDLIELELQDDFTLKLSYEIPTLLKEKDLEKLGITDFQHTKYRTTVINVEANIEQWLKDELAKGYSFAELRK